MSNFVIHVSDVWDHIQGHKYMKVKPGCHCCNFVLYITDVETFYFYDLKNTSHGPCVRNFEYLILNNAE